MRKERELFETSTYVCREVTLEADGIHYHCSIAVSQKCAKRELGDAGFCALCGFSRKIAGLERRMYPNGETICRNSVVDLWVAFDDTAVVWDHSAVFTTLGVRTKFGSLFRILGFRVEHVFSNCAGCPIGRRNFIPRASSTALVATWKRNGDLSPCTSFCFTTRHLDPIHPYFFYGCFIGCDCYAIRVALVDSAACFEQFFCLPAKLIAPARPWNSADEQ